MSRLFRTSGLSAAFAAGLMLAFTSALNAADKKSEAKAADSKSADKDSSKDPDAKADKKSADDDQFAVPDGKPAELLTFIEKLQKIQPNRANIKSQEDLVKFIKDSRGAIVKAADKVIAADADGKTRAKAIEAKLDALSLLGRVGDADAETQTKDLLAKLKDDKQPEVKQLVKFFDFRNRLGEAMSDPAAADKLLADVMTELKTSPSKNLASLASMLASRQEQLNPEAAVKSLKELSSVLSKSKDPDLEAMAKQFEGVIRRLGLMGHQIEIKGTLLDGKPFDQGTLKGKVVLVDFWATWCGPCVGELPNVKKNYEKYHDKGFEVVGVSLDRSVDDLKSFIAERKITWPILFPQDEKDQFWKNPLAVYYGVNAIPCVILTNQKGDVVSLNARGPELGKKLEELLGKVEEKEAKTDEPKSDEVKTPKK